MTKLRPLLSFVLSAALVLSACGSDDPETADETSEVAADETPAAAPTTTATVATTPTTSTTAATPEDPSATTEAPAAAEVATSEVIVTAPGLFPEGLTYDPVGDRFVMGSLIAGQLLAVDDEGGVSPFADSPGANLTGVEADVVGGRLLVAVTAVPAGVAQLSVHDLSTGEQTHLVDFATVLPDVPSFANGITVDGDGNVYVTDTGAGVIYRVDTDYQPSVFAQHESFAPVQAGALASGLNGIVHHDGALIVGHAPTGQLLRVDLGDPTQVTPIPTGVEGMAIDGMHFSDDDATLAVVSNSGSVHLFESADGWSTATEAGRFEVGKTFPTSVTDRDGTFYVLQAHLDQLGSPGVEQYEIVPVVVN